MRYAMELKDLHDKMIAEMPDGAEHASEECPFCSDEQITQRGGNMKSYSDEDIQALVAQAVADATKELTVELEGLKSTATVSEWEVKISTLQAEHDEQVAALQASLDAAVISAESAKQEYENLLAFLESEKDRVEAEAVVEARKEERVKAVSEAATFPEDYLTANTDRWAEMSDEAFEALLADYRSMGTVIPAPTPIPGKTALHATRPAGDQGSASAAREVIRLRERGIDPRELIR
jgi:hypothetical protein